MAERKVQNKYFPPDYDPRIKLPGQKKVRKSEIEREARKGGETIRLMLPFNVTCGQCGNYMYRGTKFNGKKESVEGETYLGAKIIKFRVKCDRCSNPIVFRTDPKTSGFVILSGARETLTSQGAFNPLADFKEEEEQERFKKRKELLEAGGVTTTSNGAKDASGTTLVGDGTKKLNAIAALEARAEESKREMELANELERDLKRSYERTRALERHQQIHGPSSSSSSSSASNANDPITHGGGSEEDDDVYVRALFEENRKKKQKQMMESWGNTVGKSGVSFFSSSSSNVSVAAAPAPARDAAPAPTSHGAPTPSKVLVKKLVDYDDDDDDDDE